MNDCSLILVCHIPPLLSQSLLLEHALLILELQSWKMGSISFDF